ncbi:MAG TPA: hypothetical protein VNI20_04065, partial [Fimbriimonadaceae bacterium]|nr:hypothetical protein [Fimbriimonadaceae bacterium]
RHGSFTDFPLLDTDPSASQSARIVFERISRSVRTFLEGVTKNIDRRGMLVKIDKIQGVKTIDLASIGN